MGKPKILFVGGGRRVSLARRFKEHDFEVYGYELDINCPLKSEAIHMFQGLSWSDSKLFDHLSSLCEWEEIDLVLPLQDKAAKLLAADNDWYRSKPVTSNKKANEICLNKKKFEKFCLKDFFLKSFYPDEPNGCGHDDEKVIVKPVNGCNSKGLQIMTYIDWAYFEDRLHIDDSLDNYVCQKYIENGQEISVDCYFNKNGNLIDLVPRARLEIQGGEVSKSLTFARDCYDNQIFSCCKHLGENLQLKGPICMQFIINPEDQRVYLMEVNARFGGGVILSLEAGFDIIDLIKREYILGEEVSSDQQFNWKVGFGMTRYFSEYFYESK